jgi:polysaccharide pyruvyl transferase WcaK-like protein
MSGVRNLRRIGVFGHVGNKNLGDEAIISAVIQNLRCRRPDIEIYGFTTNPEDTRERHKIASFPIRRNKNAPLKSKERKSEQAAVNSEIKQSKLKNRIKDLLKRFPPIYAFLIIIKKIPAAVGAIISEPGFLVRCFKNLKGIDLLIFAGSQQLIDFIGIWHQPFTIFKWTWIARAAGTKVAFLSVGAGPITKPLGKFFIRNALECACYGSLRDENSRRVIDQLGVNGNMPIFPDLAYSLSIESDKARSTSRDSAPITAINPVPFYDPVYWPGSNDQIYERYVSKLAHFALWLVQRGHSVLFFPTQLVLDPPVIRDILKAMETELPNMDFGQKIIAPLIESFDDLISAILMADQVVATRFHGVIIPFLLNKPVLAVAYHRKTIDLMAQMGQSEFVFDIHSSDENQLQERFTLLESRSESIEMEIAQKVSFFRKALDTQYERLLMDDPCTARSGELGRSPKSIIDEI